MKSNQSPRSNRHKTLPGVLTLTLALGLFASGTFADTTNAPAVTSFVDVAKVGLKFIDDNGSISSGYAWQLGGDHGVLLRESLSFATLTLKHTETKFTICHATMFGNTSQQQLGLGVDWKLFGSKPLQDGISSVPVVRKGLFLNFSEFRISPYIGLPVDDIFNGRFVRNNVTLGISAGFKL